jgi:hypothetical protein
LVKPFALGTHNQNSIRLWLNNPGKKNNWNGDKTHKLFLEVYFRENEL